MANPDDSLKEDSPMSCIRDLKTLEKEIRDKVTGRFNKDQSKKNEFEELVDRIVSKSLNESNKPIGSTFLYDQFQWTTNGI